MTLPPALAAIRDEAMLVSCMSWAIRARWPLMPPGGNDRSGPCPRCGGTDRFSINNLKNVWQCRQCGGAGQGVIALVMWSQDLGFLEACELITGRTADVPADERKLAADRVKAEADEKRRAAEAEAFREKARKQAFALWRSEMAALPPWQHLDWPSAVVDYWRLRGLDPALLPAPLTVIREIKSHPWVERASEARGDWHTVHTGPAQLAVIQQPDGHFAGVHVTWLDPSLGSGPGQPQPHPKGKVVLPPDARGRPRPSKKVFGTMKGGAIRLYTPEVANRIVMGEGIETTATPLCHAREPGTAYWAGVALGNMAGKAARAIDGRMMHDQPDMDDLDCFLVPDWCEELVYLGENDEAAKHPVEKATRGLRRNKRWRDQRIAAGEILPPLSIRLVMPDGDANDLNDVVMEDAGAAASAAADHAAGDEASPG